jgi:hypothetical protein
MRRRPGRCHLLADELGQRGKDVEDEPAAGRGSVEVLMQRGAPDLAFAQVGDQSNVARS